VKIDITLRDIISKLPGKFIKLLTNKEGVKLLDTSLPNVKDKRADLIVELKNGEIFHLELQTFNDKNMPFRMLEYYILIMQKYKTTNISQMVLYVGEQNLNMENSLNTKALKYSFELKDIREINCNELLTSEDMEDKILAVLCNIEDENLYINAIINEILKMNENLRKDYIKKLLSLSRYRKNINDKLLSNLKERVMPITIELKDDPYFQQGLSQGFQQGISQAVFILKDMGLSVKEIAQKTNLTAEDIEKILKDYNETSKNR